MNALFLVGATASGKSAVAQYLAERHGWAILSADSMLVYRGMDIGTAKPSASEQAAVPYGGVDLCAPDEEFSVWDYRRHALSFLRRQSAARQPVVVTGGSGLFVKALTHGLSAAGKKESRQSREYLEALLAERGVGALQELLRSRSAGALEALADPMNPRRLIRALEKLDETGREATWPEPASTAPMPGLWWGREALELRIRQRVDNMLESGLVEEAQALRDRHAGLSRTAAQAIGYAEIMAMLDGTMTLDQARERIVVRTRQLAKKQRTWFRHQAQVDWIEMSDSVGLEAAAERVSASWREHGAIDIAGA